MRSVPLMENTIILEIKSQGVPCHKISIPNCMVSFVGNIALLNVIPRTQIVGSAQQYVGL